MGVKCSGSCLVAKTNVPTFILQNTCVGKRHFGVPVKSDFMHILSNAMQLKFDVENIFYNYITIRKRINEHTMFLDIF